MDKVLKLLFNKSCWNLKQPKLIISVTGGAELKLRNEANSGGGLSRNLIEKFCRDLVKVASTTGKFSILQ